MDFNLYWFGIKCTIYDRLKDWEREREREKVPINNPVFTGTNTRLVFRNIARNQTCFCLYEVSTVSFSVFLQMWYAPS